MTYNATSVVIQRVLEAATVGITSSSNPSVFGQPVTFTASVTTAPLGSGTPTGSITFYIDGVPQSSSVTMSGGKASITLSNLAVSAVPHSISASYSGDGNFAAIPEPVVVPFSQTVNQASTTTTVSASPISGDIYGQTITLTASVTVNAPSASGIPDMGTVTFYDGSAATGILLGSAPLTAGSAFINVSNLSVNTAAGHTITAVYSGDTSYVASTGTLSGYQVAPAGTTTTLTASPASGDVFGQTVTLTATVSATPAVDGGTVSFYDGSITPANLIGTTSVDTSTGIASISTSNLSVNTSGGHTLIAVYNGDTNFTASSNSISNYLISQANSTTTVTATPASGDVYGQNATFTATLASTLTGAPAPASGTVTFYDGDVVNGTFLGSSTVTVSNGIATATLNYANLSVSPTGHTITAVYSGNGNYIFSAGALSNYIVSPAATTTTVAANPAPGSVFGQSVNFSAIITSNSPSTLTPDGGTVNFYDAGTLIGSGTVIVSGGVAKAQLNISSLSVTSHNISATYLGDANFVGSTGVLSNYTVSLANTTTTLTASPSSGSFGQPVTFTVTVVSKAPSRANIDGGTVSFYDGSVSTANLLGTVPLVVTTGVGTGTFTTSSLAVNTTPGHTIIAVYSGDSEFATSTGNLSNYQVAKAGTITTVGASPSSGDIFGQPVTLTASVTTNFTGGPMADGGTVSFYDGVAGNGLFLGSAPVNTTTGIASLTTSLLSVNTASGHTITAVYSGDTNFAAGSGSLTNYLVFPVNTSTTVTGNPTSGVYGQSSIFTATIAPTTTGSPVPSGGSVTFYDGSAATGTQLGVGTVTVLNGVASATLTVGNLAVTPAGHTITAVYSGSTNFSGSSGALVNYIVAPANTTTSIAANPGSGDVYGQSVLLTATVATAGIGGIRPDGGTVSFYDGSAATGTLLGSGTVNVNSGIATLTTSALSSTSVTGHTITAVYSGTTNFKGSSGSLTNYGVAAVHTTTTITPSPASGAVFGSSVTLTAKVTANLPSLAVPDGGTVSFYDGLPATGIFLGSSAVNPTTGTASFTTTKLSVSSSHTLFAVYSGDTNFVTSSGGITGYQVTGVGSKTSVSASPASGDTYGQNVTLTANLTAATTGGPIPDGGTVRFYDGTTSGTLLGVANVVVANGTATATLNTTALSISATGHTITAFYAGDNNFTSSSGSLSNYVVAQGVSVTSVSANPVANPTYGQAVSLIATITGQGANAAPVDGGTVKFYDGTAASGTLLGTATVNATTGVATLSTSTLAVTSNGHTITAVYSGDGNFLGSTGTKTNYTIVRATTNTSVTSAANTVAYGQAVVFTATVVPVTAGPVAPTGVMSFYVNGNYYSQATVTNGKAIISIPGLTVGTWSVTGYYVGDSNYSGSYNAANAGVVTVQGKVTETVTVSTSPINYGQSATVTAVIAASPTTPLSSSTLAPTGVVFFYVNGTYFNQATLVNGRASVATPTGLLVGPSTFTAYYQGDKYFTSLYNAAASATLIVKGATSIALVSTSPSLITGVPLTYSATIKSVSPASVTPTGPVYFFVDGSYVATATLTSSGVVNFAVMLTPGVHTLTAYYPGDTDFFGNQITIDETISNSGRLN